MNRTLITNIMKRYAFHSPVSFLEQRRIHRAKMRGLVYILSQNKKGSVRLSLAVRFYYFLQGIYGKITFARSMRVMNAAGFAFVILLGLTVIYSTGIFKGFTGGRTSSLQARVIKVSGDVTITSASGAVSGPAVWATLSSGDMLSTGSSSFVDIQSGDGIYARINAGTEAGVKVAAGRNDAGLSLEHGSIFLTGKHASNRLYSIATANCIVTPAGTTFSVKYTDRKTVVAVTEGRVLVKLLVGGTGKSVSELVLEAGSKVVVTDGIVTEKITQAEADELNKFSSEYLTGETRNDRKTTRSEKMGRLMKQGNGTIPEIKEAFNRIDVITLFSGQVIRGAIITTGRTYDVLTPQGMVKISESEVRSIEVLK